MEVKRLLNEKFRITFSTEHAKQHVTSHNLDMTYFVTGMCNNVKVNKMI